jgi:hypothetical protein
MVAASRAAAGMGYTGFEAHIFYMKVFFNRAESHLERLWILEEWYSDLRAKLPLLYEKTPNEYSRDILPRMLKLDNLVDNAWEDYRAYFEQDTFDNNELVFVRELKTILRELDEITAISKIIDKQKLSDDMDVIG